MKIKLLDCTLRDGGYVNNWDFGKEHLCKIIDELVISKIDYVELGYLKNITTPNQASIYTNIYEINDLIKDYSAHFSLMIDYGTFDLDKLPQKAKTINIEYLRITFKKNQTDEALKYCKAVQDLGYKIFINPTYIDSFSDKELVEIAEKINEIKPYGMSIVDTLGILKAKDVLRIYSLFSNNISQDIAIGFHSHNNLQLSFSNACALLENADIKNREFIIDCTLKGMGKAAGNLNTELILQHLVENYEKDYKILPVLRAIDSVIEPIFAKTPWGYSIPYYLSTANCIHPNYATFLSQKGTMKLATIDAILHTIPSEKRLKYDEKLIEKLYFDFQNHFVDDLPFIKEFQKIVENKKILLLGNGKNLTIYENEIKNFIKDDVFVISLNYDNPLANAMFFTSEKRLNALKNPQKLLIATSNLKDKSDKNMRLINYGSYVNHSKLNDNSLLMAIKFLEIAGKKELFIAACDGFSGDDYFDNNFKNTSFLALENNINNEIQMVLSEFKKSIKLHFITPSLFEDEK